MPSLSKHIDNRLVVSFLFLEKLSDLVDGDYNGTVLEAISEAWSLAGNSIKLNDKDAALIASRVKRMVDNSSSKAEGSDKVKPSYGTEELSWLSKLDPSGVCMYLADYDPDRALHLFSKVDFELVADLAEAKSHARWHEIQTDFETCLYGFGGKYESKNSGNEINANSEEGELDQATLSAIKSMGF